MEPAREPDCPLDAAVLALHERLAERVPAPDVLVLMATGGGLLAERLAETGEAALDDAEVPDPWRGAVLRHGRLGDTTLWVLDDVLGEALGGVEPAWAAGLPCWLAAHAGATICVHTSAGGALPAAEAAPAAGTLALVSDHINLSGGSPLTGLGESRLGPLFPDLTRLHDPELRSAARARAAELGIPVTECVVACTPGPSLETPAEARWLALAGAQVSVQGLATPLLAAAHAGLAVLSVVAVTAGGPEDSSVEDVVARAQALAPALEDLLVALGPDLARASRSRSATP